MTRCPARFFETIQTSSYRWGGKKNIQTPPCVIKIWWRFNPFQPACAVRFLKVTLRRLYYFLSAVEALNKALSLVFWYLFWSLSSLNKQLAQFPEYGAHFWLAEREVIGRRPYTFTLQRATLHCGACKGVKERGMSESLRPVPGHIGEIYRNIYT